MWIMMNKKLTTMLFSLLLAVGWTTGASAQKLANSTATENLRHSMQMESETNRSPYVLKANGVMSTPQRAPQRTPNTITAEEVRTGAWWADKTYTWYNTYPASGSGQTANFTTPATDPYQMMYMVKEIYTNTLYPGIQYNEVEQSPTDYPVVDYGWALTQTGYTQFRIIFNNSYAYFSGITVSDATTDETIQTWSTSTTSSTLGTIPAWMKPSKTIQKGRISSGVYGCYLDGGGTITIDGAYLQGHSSIKITVVSRTTNNGGGTVSINGAMATLTTSWGNWANTTGFPNVGTSTPPDYNGYTVMLVKVKDDATDFPATTSTSQDLIDNCFSKYESIELLTDGLRVGQGTSNAGTVFAYTGTLNRFFFIGKGKTAQWDAHAPFYEMYEEFSPTALDQGAEIKDFYEKMKQGATYGIQHDCESVSYREHYFSMSGKDGTTHNFVNSLVLYIPDDRSETGYRTYDHQPTVGMYMIDLYANVEPSTTPDYYTVTVDWFDNLGAITHDENIPQTYTLYAIWDENKDGVLDTIPVYTGSNTTWNHDYPVGDPSYYDISYYVIGTPTNATNQDTFFAKSNTDDVTIPGTRDFLGLQWQRYESDYVILSESEQVNYYRNWLAPHALSVQGEAGINAGNVGNTGRTLTVYRNDGTKETPIMYLDLIMDGNKAYYRIRYINREENQQVEPGYDPETGEMTTNNNNN